MTDFSIYITFDEIESYQYITNIYPLAMDREKVIEGVIKMYENKFILTTLYEYVGVWFWSF